jgi:2,4-dihydroxyhept-2-ene-1,7-dioic acid aldolase
MFPHVDSPEKAREVARACRYAGGSRGFAGMTRASGWGARPGPRHMEEQDRQIACIAMIEDISALEHVPAIAATEGIDALFVGRGDLTASFGSDPDARTKVAEMTAQIAEAARAAGVPLMTLATSTADAAAMRALGSRAMLVSSDHNFLKSAASAALREYGTAAQ